ncbi:MAG TPA: DNA polymerase III subunit chi [Sphingomicrobium sp.]|nr:DNA polymerase III subunit chi [Sphingomicrobium sp.]
MRVDFYQLGDSAPEGVIASLAEKVLEKGERLLIVAGDESYLARLDRMLWDQGATSYLAHGLVDGPDDTRQPILLSNREDAPNLARNMIIADGEWREAALTFDRAFFLFGGETVEGARLTWKLLSGREGIERHYWANEAGRWVQKS